MIGARWSLGPRRGSPQAPRHGQQGDFDEYFAFHLRQEKRRNHDSRYQQSKAPDSKQRPSRPDRPMPERRPAPAVAGLQHHLGVRPARLISAALRAGLLVIRDVPAFGLAVSVVFASIRADVTAAEDLCRRAADASARRDIRDWRVEEAICAARQNIANTRGAFADAARPAVQAAGLAEAAGDLADAPPKPGPFTPRSSTAPPTPTRSRHRTLPGRSARPPPQPSASRAPRDSAHTARTWTGTRPSLTPSPRPPKPW